MTFPHGSQTLRTHHRPVLPRSPRFSQVSVGAAVDDLLKDPSSSKWKNVSVEFCGGTHLSNTKEAGSFVLLSEEGIAKGIRRIVGLTSTGADAATKLAADFQGKLEAAGKLQGAALEKELAALKGSLATAPVPAARKAELNAMVADLSKRVAEAAKAAEKANKDKAVAAAVKAADAALKAGSKYFVLTIDVGMDANALREGAVEAQKKGVAAALFSSDAAAGKSVVYVAVPEAFKGLEAKAWLQTALTPLGGKGGGGKGGLAQGQGGSPEKLKDAVAAAEAFAKAAKIA